MKIRTHLSLAHFAPDMHPTHGPQVWPWWRLFSISHCRLDTTPPTTGHRWWLYTRWGAGHAGIVFDRRKA